MNPFETQFEAYLVILLIAGYLSVNILFALSLAGVINTHKGMFDNWAARIFCGPTLIICSVLFFIYKIIAFQIRKRRFEKKYEKTDQFGIFKEGK